MTKGVCSPSVKGKSYSCYSDNALHKLKELWNARHPDSKIVTNNEKEIWKALKDHLGNVCETETCWLKQKFVDLKFKNELLNYTFAPFSPVSWNKDPNEWLTSVDIESVLKQYEDKYKNFIFIGPSPIDFDKQMLYNQCVWDELCKFDLEKLIKKGKNKIGVIFNTDPHYKDGAHWISMFIDIKQKYIFFFDSVGDKPPKEIVKLMERIKDQGKQLDIDFDLIVNKKSHQRGDTECGIYSLFVITELLQGTKQPEYFLDNRIPDKEMEKLRKKYFNETPVLKGNN